MPSIFLLACGKAVSVKVFDAKCQMNSFTGLLETRILAAKV